VALFVAATAIVAVVVTVFEIEPNGYWGALEETGRNLTSPLSVKVGWKEVETPLGKSSTYLAKL